LKKRVKEDAQSMGQCNSSNATGAQTKPGPVNTAEAKKASVKQSSPKQVSYKSVVAVKNVLSE
jgi:hypothetical protein